MNGHSHLIDALGGTADVAGKFSQNLSTVSNWRERGIPYRWRPAVATLANEKGVELPEGFLPGVAA